MQLCCCCLTLSLAALALVRFNRRWWWWDIAGRQDEREKKVTHESGQPQALIHTIHSLTRTQAIHSINFYLLLHVKRCVQPRFDLYFEIFPCRFVELLSVIFVVVFFSFLFFVFFHRLCFSCVLKDGLSSYPSFLPTYFSRYTNKANNSIEVWRKCCQWKPFSIDYHWNNKLLLGEKEQSFVPIYPLTVYIHVYMTRSRFSDTHRCKCAWIITTKRTINLFRSVSFLVVVGFSLFPFASFTRADNFRFKKTNTRMHFDGNVCRPAVWVCASDAETEFTVTHNFLFPSHSMNHYYFRVCGMPVDSIEGTKNVGPFVPTPSSRFHAHFSKYTKKLNKNESEKRFKPF